MSTTAAMFDDLADREERDRHNAALLRTGTLIHLWAPGDQPWHDGARPVTARVKTARKDFIEAIDTRFGTAVWYEVGTDLTNPAKLRWTWEVIEAPERPAAIEGIERIDGTRLSIEDRVRLLCGEPGTTVRFGMVDGSSVTGVLTTVICDDPHALEAHWCLLEGKHDSRGRIPHWVRVRDISTVTPVHG